MLVWVEQAMEWATDQAGTGKQSDQAEHNYHRSFLLGQVSLLVHLGCGAKKISEWHAQKIRPHTGLVVVRAARVICLSCRLCWRDYLEGAFVVGVNGMRQTDWLPPHRGWSIFVMVWWYGNTKALVRFDSKTGDVVWMQLVRLHTLVWYGGIVRFLMYASIFFDLSRFREKWLLQSCRA